jgi:uncharacterized protein
MTETKHFFLKLNPPRSSFTLDMNADELRIMQQHLVYWKPYVNDGTAIVLGPVADPKGGYGIAVVGVSDESELEQLLGQDPANGLCSYEIHPMQAVTRQI